MAILNSTYEKPGESNLASIPADLPEDVVSLNIPEIGETIHFWKSYDFSTDFMDATSSFSFEVADENFRALASKLQNGHRVQLLINGTIQATGFVDNITIGYGSGTTMRISGRDALSPAADSCVDPKYIAKANVTMGQLMLDLFSPFGFKEIKVDDRLNLQKLTKTSSVFTTDDNHNIIEKLVNSKLPNKLKPTHGEGIYEFAARLGRRHGFHIWSSVDGETLYIGRPNFSSAPIGTLIHKVTDPSANNVLQGSVSYDWANQPSVIIAEGHGGGGRFRKSSNKVLLVNELLSDSDADIPAVVELKKRYPEALVIPRRAEIAKPSQIATVDSKAFAKTVFLYDDQSFDKQQLKNYAIRRMAEFQSRFMVATFTVNRHSRNGVVWAPNTIVSVKDEALGIDGPLWIKSRRFIKDRSGGTRTELKCILPHTLQLTENQNG